MAASPPSYVAQLPNLTTGGLPLDLSADLPTGPAFGGFRAEGWLNYFTFEEANSQTIDPHPLRRYGTASSGVDGPVSPFRHVRAGVVVPAAVIEDGRSFDWMAEGFENQMLIADGSGQSIDDSSPSGMITDTYQRESHLLDSMQWSQ
jgi:hypothetical protein